MNNLIAQVPNGAAGYYLLGRICVASNRHDAAIQYFSAALTLDPLLWCAYEELCNLGEQLHVCLSTFLDIMTTACGHCSDKTKNRWNSMSSPSTCIFAGADSKAEELIYCGFPPEASTMEPWDVDAEAQTPHAVQQLASRGGLDTGPSTRSSWGSGAADSTPAASQHMHAVLGSQQPPFQVDCLPLPTAVCCVKCSI